MDMATLGTKIKDAIDGKIANKQDVLTFKTIGGESIVGEGNIEIQSSGGSRNVDGGSAASVYLPTQVINGGNANG